MPDHQQHPQPATIDPAGRAAPVPSRVCPPVPTLPGVPSTPGRRQHGGRPVITRAEVIAALGIGRSTAEGWYRDRATNGHPEPVATEGRLLLWDEKELLAFAREQLDPAPTPDRIVRDGRTLITRAEAARLCRFAESHLLALYAQRAETGHPEVVHREGRRVYFDEVAMRAFIAQWRAAKVAGLTAVDRSGDPAELVDMTEAARVLGFSGPKTISGYRSRHPGYFPEADATEPLRWTRGTLWRFADRRSLPGRAGLPPDEL